MPFRLNEYLRLLHLPTTSCILAFGMIGSAFAPIIYLDRLLWTLILLFLIGGVASNYFDEICGRPWHTTMPEKHLWMIGIISTFGAVVVGIHLMLTVTAWLWVFIAVWSFFSLTYNLELCEGRFHNTPSIALSWGSVCLGSFFVQTQTITPHVLIASVITGIIAGRGRDLYETAKPFSKDKDPSAGVISSRAWTLLKVLILLIDVNAAIMLIWRL